MSTKKFNAMFLLHKKRNFSELISDTFLFFRKNGKHFFKLYFTINGAFLLISSVLIYFIFKIYFEFLFSSLSSGIQSESNSVVTLLENNTEIFIVIAILGVLFLVFMSLLQFTFPVVYLDLLEKKQNQNFGVREVISGLKSNTLKLIKFLLGSLFVFIPIALIVLTINIFLCFIIIGFLLFIITLPFLMSWFHLTFYHYIIGKKRFFAALIDAFSNVKQQFWNITLSTLVMYVIIQIVMTILSMIPYVFGIATLFTNPKGTYNQTEGLNIVTIIMIAVMIVSLIANYILNNLIIVNQGLIYYTLQEQNENISAKNSIDLIGSESE